MYLFDTHTHFDVPEYDDARDDYHRRAYDVGVHHLVLVGFLASYFDRMTKVAAMANDKDHIRHHLAFGLHPLYISCHTLGDLDILETFIKRHRPIALGEIGLDTYPTHLKNGELLDKQRLFFVEQIALAKTYHLPIMLHIRKSHGAVLDILKTQRYNPMHYGGIAHSFSGGVNEALAFAKMGFKIGITGQITNPNAKKLRNSVQAVFDNYGASAFVIETDCPDMMPLPCQQYGHFNSPQNLPFVLDTLALLCDMDKEKLAQILWQNTNQALHLTIEYPL